MKSIGYARSASSTSKLDAQVDKLRQAGCDPVFSESVSGLTDERPELAKAIATLVKGDELVVVDLARLGRDATLIVNSLAAIEACGATLRSLSDDLPR